MIIEVTNLTDAPGKSPKQIDIFNRVLGPGDSLRLPVDLVNKKLRALEKTGDIAIGQIPAWYKTAKSRKGRPLTEEEMKKRIASPPNPVSTQEVGKKIELHDTHEADDLPWSDSEVVDEMSRERRRRR